jgi:ATP-dependent helicase/nuclease subunit A
MTQPIDVITASAGTGKTYRVVQEAQSALDGGLDPERLMAVTFTVRAAEELRERLRSHLLAQSRTTEAERLLGARIGTVHAVFGALLHEFAFEAGRSPLVDVLAEEVVGPSFAIAADTAIARHAQTLEPLAARFGLRGRRVKLDWRDIVRDIVDLARQNDIGPDQLADSAHRSWGGLASLLAKPDQRGASALDRALVEAVDNALRALPGSSDTTKATADALAALQRVAPLLQSRPDELPWPDWARLARLPSGAASRAIVAPVQTAASAHPTHPCLTADLRAFVEGVFSCAAEAMRDYQIWKAQQGLVDFPDQEAGALHLLAQPQVRGALAERVHLLLVDEFQDTSPIQLALFLSMAAIVRRSVWVGDPKQAIYGFRGADPEVMALAASQVAPATGGRNDSLATSRRSRPALVAFFDDLFVPSFQRHGLSERQIALRDAARMDACAETPALAMMGLQAKNADEEAQALADGIRVMLAAPKNWPVQPRRSDTVRAMQPGDIAVLCRRNERCAAVAKALEARGIAAAIGRAGLLDAAEVVAALAALRVAADPSDRLALAELARLGGADDAAWLTASLAPEREALEKLVPAVPALAALRERMLHLTPTEALDAAIEAADVHRFAVAWGDAESRLANLDALRGLAASYQETSASLAAPATTSGLIAWITAQDGAEQPASLDPNSVQVLTCHGSKGLEWPVVVLGDLGEPPEPRLFDYVVAEPGAAFDWRAPLAGRWVRFWPWPYGDLTAGVAQPEMMRRVNRLKSVGSDCR